MTATYAIAALCLLITLAVGLIRMLRGPTPADRMIAAQLIGTTGIAVLLMLEPLLQTPALIDVALIFALLAAVATAAFTRPGAGSRDPR